MDIIDDNLAVKIAQKSWYKNTIYYYGTNPERPYTFRSFLFGFGAGYRPNGNLGNAYSIPSQGLAGSATFRPVL